MSSTTANASALLAPSDVQALLVQPTMNLSVAAQALTVVGTSSTEHRVPFVSADPTASWVPEGGEIAPSDLAVSEIRVRPRKLAALTVISRELAEDSSPAAQTAVGLGLARDLARKLDLALFTAVGGEAPAGLAALAGISTVSAGTKFTNTDPFLEAISVAETVGATVTSFITGPTTALALSQIKAATGSNATLLQPDPTRPTGRVVSGVPLLVSAAVPAGVVYAVPSDRSLLVVRADSRIDVDASVYFTSDRVAVRATMRAAFGFAHPAAIVRIAITGA